MSTEAKSKTKASTKSRTTKAESKAKPKKDKPEPTDLQKLARAVNKLNAAKTRKGMSKAEAKRKADEKFAKRFEKLDEIEKNGADDKMLERVEKAKVQHEKLQTRLAKLEEAIYKKQQLIVKLENGNVEARREALDARKEKYIDNLVHPASGKRVAELEAEVAELAAKCGIGS